MSPLSEDPETLENLHISSCESNFDLDRDPATPPTPRALGTPKLPDSKSIRCTFEDCCKRFNRSARLIEHLRSHTNSRPFICPQNGCEKNFLRDTHLKHHIKSAHSSVRDYVCSWDRCGKGFATGTRLRRHEAAHESKEKWQCTAYSGCDLTFRKHDTLQRHIKTVHEFRKAFPCTELDSVSRESCASGFDTAEKLRAHQRAKHDPARLICIECLDFFAGNRVTDDHDEDLVDNYPLACFSSADALKLHIAALHPSACPYCPTSFGNVRELRMHLRQIHDITETGKSSVEFDFPCSHIGCKRSFSKKGNLNVHITTVHEKRRDFICGRTELSLRDLPCKSHSEVWHSDIDGCGRDFTSKSTLEEHVRTVHLGLGSKRMEREREKKRKAELSRAANEEPCPKKRKSRKGRRKLPAMAALAGFDDKATSTGTSTSYPPWGELTGADTMFDGRTFGRDFGGLCEKDFTPSPKALSPVMEASNLFEDGDWVDASYGFYPDTLPVDPQLIQA